MLILNRSNQVNGIRAQRAPSLLAPENLEDTMPDVAGIPGVRCEGECLDRMCVSVACRVPTLHLDSGVGFGCTFDGCV